MAWMHCLSDETSLRGSLTPPLRSPLSSFDRTHLSDETSLKSNSISYLNHVISVRVRTPLFDETSLIGSVLSTSGLSVQQRSVYLSDGGAGIDFREL